MLAVVIPTRNDAERLALTLAALVPAAADGIVREVLVADGGSTDVTLRIAEETGCSIVPAEGGPGEGLSRAAAASRRGDWLMFLRPGVVLEHGWSQEVAAFVDRLGRAGRAEERAAVFRYAVDDVTLSARASRLAAGLAHGITGLPHPAQPLLISKGFYRRLGGHRPMAALEDVDLARRIGRSRLVTLRGEAAWVPVRPASGMKSTGRSRRVISRALAGVGVPASLLVRLHG